MNDRIIKYPKTPHIKGSKLQKGDEDLSQIPFSKIKDKFLVIEEKVDGANVGISFDDEGKMMLQSRGHYLVGGYREKHYEQFKLWATLKYNELFGILKNRYIMYGEWLYVKHKIYYDILPDYFLEFDIFDKEKKIFLDTSKRQELLKNSSIHSVPILKSGKFSSIDEILSNLTNSKFISINYLENLQKEVEKRGLDIESVLNETQKSMLMEGLYIKVEDSEEVVDRMKYVRYNYTQINTDDGYFLAKPIIANKLKEN